MSDLINKTPHPLVIAGLAPKMLEAIRSWHEYWDDTYDGRPLRDYEFKMLEILRKVDQ